MNWYYRNICVLCVAMAAVCVLAFTAESAPAGAKAKPKAKAKTKAEEETPSWQLPWTLREHYSFTVEKSTLYYAADNAEWQVTVEGAGPVIDKARFQITLADGTVLDSLSLGKATAEYDRFTDALGDGMLFSTTFPEKDGLLVRHRMSVNSERPFVLITLGLGNNSDKPIEITKIAPVVIGPGGIANLTPGADMMSRHVSFRGTCPVFDKNAPPSLAIFNDSARDITLCLGALPQGIAASHVEFQSNGGQVVCEYDPPIRLAPGEKIESNPIWVSVGLPHPVDVDVLNAWTASLMPRLGPNPAAADATLNQDVPRSWITVEEGKPLSELVQSLERWSAIKPQGVLVPISWEGRPGSLEGAVPRYPKNMSKAASDLRGPGIKAGLTIDPLLTNEGSPDWTAQSADGCSWLNLSAPEARAHAVERMKKVAGWGFDFFAIAPSAIPAEVLKHFNMTRVQADQLAFAVMMEAAGNRPVLPTAAYTAKADLDLWLEVAASSICMATYGIVPGPVRLDVNGVNELSDELLTAMTFFGGPVELLDRAKPKVVDALARFFSQNRFNERPIDAAKCPPRVWYVPQFPPDADYRPGVVVLFAGAGAWTSHWTSGCGMWSAQQSPTLTRRLTWPPPPAGPLTWPHFTSRPAPTGWKPKRGLQHCQA